MHDVRRTLAILNQKGGVGKTTVTLGLASAAAAAGRRTLVVDLDPQGNSTITFVDPAAFELSVYDLLTDQTVTPQECIRSTSLSNLSLLPSRIALAKIESKLVGEFDAPFRLKDRLEGLRGAFDFIIVDTHDCLLIYPKSDEQSIKSLKETLRAKGFDSYL